MFDRAAIRERAFHWLTGMMAPGKDIGAAAGNSPLCDSEVRGKTWSLLIDAHGRTINAILDACSDWVEEQNA